MLVSCFGGSINFRQPVTRQDLDLDIENKEIRRKKKQQSKTYQQQSRLQIRLMQKKRDDESKALD